MFVWTNTMKEIIPTLQATDFGWKISEETNNLTPLWFDGSQLPPSLIRGNKKKNTKSPPGYEADLEEEPPVKRTKKNFAQKKRTTKNRMIEINQTYCETTTTEDKSFTSSTSSNSEWEHFSDFVSFSEDSTDSDWFM